MQLIQLHSCFHGANEAAADSTAFCFFHFGERGRLGPLGPGPPQNEKKNWQLNQLPNFSWNKTWQLNQLPNFHIFYYETYFLFRNEEYLKQRLFLSCVLCLLGLSLGPNKLLKQIIPVCCGCAWACLLAGKSEVTSETDFTPGAPVCAHWASKVQWIIFHRRNHRHGPLAVRKDPRNSRAVPRVKFRL